ncbi:MAG TPA: hypothetical protein VNL15_02790, partial [Dehalococcoidia bacterium]|nr:hypothetical protein [Dehalococcoidia bacterium]
AGTVFGLVMWLVLEGRRLHETSSCLFVILALAFLAELVLPTRTLSRYFVFPLAFSTLAMATPYRWPSVLVFAGLSVTTLAGSYGSMAVVLDSFPEHAPRLAPESNPVSALMLYLFQSDVFISVAASVNLLSMAVLMGSLLWAARRRSPVTPEHDAAEQAAVTPLSPQPSFFTVRTETRPF